MRRRQFLKSAVAFPVILASRQSTLGAEYDLLIRGGRVIDPAQRIDRAADVAVRAGKIAAVKTGIPASSAAQVIDASGKIVTPGLIDIHVHAVDPKLPPSEFLSMGVTAMLDGGSKGADEIDQFVNVARSAPNHLRVLLNISRTGNNPGGRGEYLDGIEPANVELCRAAAMQHRDYIVGIKARLSEIVAKDQDVEVLRRAREVADFVRLPIMIHMGGTHAPLPQLLSMLRPGDIVTHVYSPPPHGIMDDKGQILPEVLAARKRGIRFDFGNGRVEHWTWEVAQNALKQGFRPDTISTDLNLIGTTDQAFNLPTVMSKFLLMGMPVAAVVACVTWNAARSIKAFNAYGTLRPGAAADITVMELTHGDFEFVDNYKGTRKGGEKLVTRAVVAGGKRIV